MVGGTNNSAIAFVEVLGYKTRHKIECVANRKLEHLEEVQKMETIDADLLSSGVGLRLQGGVGKAACLFVCLPASSSKGHEVQDEPCCPSDPSYMYSMYSAEASWHPGVALGSRLSASRSLGRPRAAAHARRFGWFSTHRWPTDRPSVAKECYMLPVPIGHPCVQRKGMNEF